MKGVLLITKDNLDNNTRAEADKLVIFHNMSWA